MPSNQVYILYIIYFEGVCLTHVIPAPGACGRGVRAVVDDHHTLPHPHNKSAGPCFSSGIRLRNWKTVLTDLLFLIPSDAV